MAFLRAYQLLLYLRVGIFESLTDWESKYLDNMIDSVLTSHRE